MQGVSYSALRKVVAALRNDPLSKRELVDVARERYELVAHKLQMPAVGGGNVVIPVCHPLELLSLLVRENEYVRSWVERAWGARPSTRDCPWRLLIGWDEFVPGNKQAIRNDRKQWY